MTPGSSPGRGRWLALSLLIALITVIPAPQARAQTAQVAVELVSLELTGTGPRDQVVLRVSVTGAGDEPVFGARAVLWRSRDPIRDLPTLRRAADGTTPWGTPLDRRDDHHAVLSQPGEEFAPGVTREVTLRATLAELGFASRGAAYAVGLQVTGYIAGNAAPLEVGRLRTFVAVPARTPVPVTSIVLLSSAPAKLWTGEFVDDHLAEELTGRLDDLMDAAERPGMSYLIDPDLLDAVTDMADGYTVIGRDGPLPGAGQEAAISWLARAKGLDATAGGRTLFANPDVHGAAVAGDPEVLARARTAAGGVAVIGSRPLVVVPGALRATTALLDYLDPASATAVVARNTLAAGAWQSTRNGPGVLAVSRAFGIDDGLVAAERVQLALAEAVLAGDAGQARLLTEPQDVTLDTRATAEWTRRRELGPLLATKPSTETASFEISRVDRLVKAQFAELTGAEADFADYGELVPESALTAQAAAALSRGASSAWIDDDAGFRRYLGAIDDTIGPDTVATAVTLDASPRFLMSSRSNQFPLTVTNNLREPIRVRVVMTADAPQRLRVPDSDLVTVGPGRSETVTVRPEASANGLVTARAHVETSNGRRVTEDVRITVEITDLGMVAWAIVLASGLVLIAATVWRIRQVRARTAPAPEAGDE